MSPTSRPDDPSSPASSCRTSSGSGSQESVITLADVSSLGDLSIGEFSCPTCTTYDPICAASETVANSLCKWAEPSQTLIFLDWDDTLFATSEIVDDWGLPPRFQDWNDMVFSNEQEHLLDKWGSALELYLKTTCSLSNHCVILTNAKRPWVTKCVERFAPRLKPLFDREDGPRVVYAREAPARPGHRRPCSTGNPAWTTSEASPDERRLELTSAKLAAMRQEAKRFYSQYPNQTWKNIISVGDASY
jgi:hypothetical protein